MTRVKSRFWREEKAYDVLVGENHTSYVDESGVLRPLPPIVTKSGTEMYIIRGFHQMHCVVRESPLLLLSPFFYLQFLLADAFATS